MELNKFMNKFVSDYDSVDDILTIYNSEKQVKETVEFTELINLDLDNDGKVVGVEIFEASKLLPQFNPQLNLEFLKNIKFASLEYKEHRNLWFVVVILTNNKNVVIRQAMPPLMRSAFISPLIASS